MLNSWFRNRRRRRLLAEPLPLAWLELLRTNVRHYQYLPADQQRRVHQIVPVLVAEKEWAGAAGFEVTVEMQVTIAGIAAVMVSGLEELYYFDRLHTIVLHPGNVRFTPEQSARNPGLPEPNVLQGVAWHRGPVLLSWRAVLREARGRNPGDNVTIHELAHHLDSLDGHMSGTPPMSPSKARQWDAIAGAEFERTCTTVDRGGESLFSDGAESRAEFFAVASERFFEVPHLMRRWHEDLYATLADFYRQDPTQYLPRRGRAEAAEI